MRFISVVLPLLLSTIVWARLPRITCDSNNPCKGNYLNNSIIKCESTESCAAATLIASDRIKCAGSQSCRRNKAIVAENDIICQGYQSCYQSQGDIVSLSGNVKCIGDTSCSKVGGNFGNGQIRGNDVKCMNARSCQFSTINATGNVLISGYLSCSGGCTAFAQGDIVVLGTRT